MSSHEVAGEVLFLQLACGHVLALHKLDLLDRSLGIKSGGSTVEKRLPA